MSYIALRDFDQFKNGDSIPEEIVEGRLIRGKKIGLADGSEPVKEVEEIKEELITEIIETTQTEEILLEDSSAVSVEVKEEVVPEVQETTKETKKSKK